MQVADFLRDDLRPWAEQLWTQRLHDLGVTNEAVDPLALFLAVLHEVPQSELQRESMYNVLPALIGALPRLEAAPGLRTVLAALPLGMHTAALRGLALRGDGAVRIALDDEETCAHVRELAPQLGEVRRVQLHLRAGAEPMTAQAARARALLAAFPAPPCVARLVLDESRELSSAVVKQFSEAVRSLHTQPTEVIANQHSLAGAHIAVTPLHRGVGNDLAFVLAQIAAPVSVSVNASPTLRACETLEYCVAPGTGEINAMQSVALRTSQVMPARGAALARLLTQAGQLRELVANISKSQGGGGSPSAISRIAEQLPTLHQLKVLDLHDTDLSDTDDAMLLAAALRNLSTKEKQMQTVALTSCNMRTGGFAAVLNAIKLFWHLHTLKLANNYVNGRGAVEMVQVCHRLRWLKVLDVQHCGLGAAGVIAVVRALADHESLEELSIGDNYTIDALPAGTAHPLAVVLAEAPSCTLTALDVRHMLHAADRARVAGLGLVLGRFQSVSYLSLADNAVGPGDSTDVAVLQHFVATVQQIADGMPALASLSLEATGLTDAAVQFAAPAFCAMQALTSLCIARNELSNASLEALAAAGEAENKSAFLVDSCAGNRFSAYCLGDCERIVNVNSSVAALHKHAGAEPLVGDMTSFVLLLQRWTGLQCVHISCHKLSTAQLLQLATSLHDAHMIEDLTLVQCAIDDDGAAALASGIACLRGLQILNLSSNFIACAGACAIARALQPATKAATSLRTAAAAELHRQCRFSRYCAPDACCHQSRYHQHFQAAATAVHQWGPCVCGGQHA